MVRLCFILLLLLFCYYVADAHKEFPDSVAYYNAFPLGKHTGLDGHWLKADRKHHDKIWDTANEINLRKKDGFKEYNSIEERSAFYKWFQSKTNLLGFETKWTGIAAITTRKLSELLNPIPCLTGNSNKEIKAFVIYGNQLIFDDIWIDLQSLRNGKILCGDSAKEWDGKLLWREQNLINPSYLKLSVHSKKILLKALRKENAFSKFFAGLEFEGDLLSIQDRWNYGMRMMGY